ncbi:hypothetical protein [Lyticum sinuosum]|uniref:Uncharacterized protein n=1 Tax=Lyticum sinuosum TaxID=1332059 RepID=A0AAE4VLY5_9RICK|nr:hypothetical protein [Lyticum sinuosum]MDZ5760974.1 hypothetical protein [Lyticum sinuosum]
MQQYLKNIQELKIQYKKNVENIEDIINLMNKINTKINSEDITNKENLKKLREYSKKFHENIKILMEENRVLHQQIMTELEVINLIKEKNIQQETGNNQQNNIQQETKIQEISKIQKNIQQNKPEISNKIPSKEVSHVNPYVQKNIDKTKKFSNILSGQTQNPQTTVAFQQETKIQKNIQQEIGNNQQNNIQQQSNIKIDNNLEKEPLFFQRIFNIIAQSTSKYLSAIKISYNKSQIKTKEFSNNGNNQHIQK